MDTHTHKDFTKSQEDTVQQKQAITRKKKTTFTVCTLYIYYNHLRFSRSRPLEQFDFVRAELLEAVLDPLVMMPGGFLGENLGTSRSFTADPHIEGVVMVHLNKK
jgi:hypothetical protein